MRDDNAVRTRGGLGAGLLCRHLLNQKHASPRTLATYRDAFRLLLRFVRETHGIEPAALTVDHLDAPVILAFLDHIERQRANSIRSRNARLAAIRSFFRFVQMREPAAVATASRVLAIPVKRTERKLVGYLTRPEIDALLSAADLTNRDGRRDHALLLTLITVAPVFPRSLVSAAMKLFSTRPPP